MLIDEAYMVYTIAWIEPYEHGVCGQRALIITVN